MVRRVNRKRAVRRSSSQWRDNKQPRASKMIEKGIDYNKLVSNAGYMANAVKTLYGLVNSEKLFLDTTLTAQSITNTGSIQPLSMMAQGDTDSGRTGQKVLLKDVSIRGNVVMNPLAGSTNVRLILFVDKFQNGTYPTTTDVLQTASVYSPLDIDDSQGRFVILWSKNFQFDNLNKGTASFSIYKKLQFHCCYKGTSNAEADGGRNQLYLLFLGNEATNTPVFSMYSRVKYVDN